MIPVVGRGFSFEDLKPGFKFRTHRRTVAEADVTAFINLTWLTEELFAVADESARAIKGRPVPGALIYAFAGRLDLDHLGAEVRERLGAEGARDERPQFEDLHTGKRSSRSHSKKEIGL